MPEPSVLESVYDPQAVEPRINELWEETNAFKSDPDADSPKGTFTMVIPPPNVTGVLHLGHALNNTLQDILIRYHRMCGFNTLWQPGTDHAGIATQAVVEKRIHEQEGKTRHELGREELVKRIWQWKDEYEKRIIHQLKQMGCSCDWSRNRFTLDDDMVCAVRHQFFNLFKDGLIFRGKRLVNWDTQLQTAVSDDEVYYETVKGHFWHFKYPVIDPRPGEPEFVIIATTRPETMLGDTAVAVHPDPEGFILKQEKHLKEKLGESKGKDRAQIESKLESLQRRRESHLQRLVQLRDMANDGRRLRLPLVEREIPLITDEWADPTKGSGCVKITPAHDPNDYEVGLRHDLPMINVLTEDGKVAQIVEPDGKVNARSCEYEGLTFDTDARKKVVSDMESRGLLAEIEDHEVEISHSDRSKFPIEPFLSDQWFVKTGDISEPRASARADEPISPEPRAKLNPDLSGARADTENLSEPRASARAARRSPDLSQGATLLTWTTYGTWLPGDQRGYVSRTPQPDESHILHNLPGEPYDIDQPDVKNSSIDKLDGEPVYISPEHANSILYTIADASERHGIELLAVAIMSNHVHVLCQSEQHGIELLQLIKGNCSRELNKQYHLKDSPRWWTKSGSRRRIKPGSDLTAAIEYVQKQNNALLMWSFDQDFGESLEMINTARAEARGSGGIRLGDGSSAPGLAQAAMDVVENGDIKVFPERYAKSYLDWLGEKRDWCISRQLWWGHRISIWNFEFNTAQWFELGEKYLFEQEKQKHLNTLNEFFKSCKVFDDIHVGYVDPIKEEQDIYLWRICCRNARANQAIEGLFQILAHKATSDNTLIRSYMQEKEYFKELFGEDALKKMGALRSVLNPVSQDPDVLDTWFSSALWPFSTLGWPEKTAHLKTYYPGSVLCTSRDIITNWVARMVMFGLYSMGKIPFEHVYIHPKILDGRGETMSKSKGNGVNPLDIIHTHGADALRYTMADICTETQDIRMPVEYVCPHCGMLTEQTVAIKAEQQARKSRGEKLERKLQPADCHRVKCVNKECRKEFATQWADESTIQELGLARETSDKYDIGRFFCNKLWNAARFAFMNLENTPCKPIKIDQLLPEDRWILARLSLTIKRYHECLKNYQFSLSIKELREFFWDSLCDWYIELTKPRLTSEPQASACADLPEQHDDPVKQVLAFCIDQVLRLWHPTLPFITERLWEQLNSIVPARGLPGIAELKTDGLLVHAEFPPDNGYPELDDDSMVQLFEEIQQVVRAVRDLRSQCDVSPKDAVTATVVLPAAQCEQFATQSHIVQQMANVKSLAIKSDAKRPVNAGSITVGSLRVYVHDISNDEAEKSRTNKALQHLEKQISGKQTKLSNEKFVTNAKPEVVEAERSRLDDLLTQQAGLQQHLSELN